METELKIPVLAIVRLKHLVSYVREAATAQSEKSPDDLLLRVETYRAKYGVEY